MTTERRIIQWAAERGILEHGTKTGQTLKLLSEVGELADGILSENSALILDALGDVGVCVVIVAHMHNLEIDDLQRQNVKVNNLKEKMLHITLHAGLLADGVAKGEQQVIQAQLGAVWSWINAMAAHLEWSFGDALFCAWETISTRRGAMGPNGTWVKQ